MNKRQRKKAMKKYMQRCPTARPKSAVALQNFPIPVTYGQEVPMLLIIDSISVLWDEILQRCYADMQPAIDVTYEHITLDQPERSLVLGGPDDSRRRLLAAGPEPPAGGTQPVDDAGVHGRGSEKETD